MNIDELIARLQTIRAVIGDATVTCGGTRNPDWTLKGEPESEVVNLMVGDVTDELGLRVRLGELEHWQHMGACRICGKVQAVDGCNYCDKCYPYDQSTDKYKQAVESRDIDYPKCTHNYDNSDTCSHCGTTRVPVVL
jgi:hypothetical protein